MTIKHKHRTHPTGEFSGTIVDGKFLLDKESKERLEQQNVAKCKQHNQHRVH